MKRPYRSDLIKKLHARIQEEFMTDKSYTFTCQDFNHLAQSIKDQDCIRSDIWKRSNGLTKHVQMFKVVGQRKGERKHLTLYAPLESTLPRWNGLPKFERKFTEKDELILDREHRREAEATPAPVIDLHNILFNLGARK